ncbi:unnamed protein product [Vitrella brassicaformis CCMP3155]|uniref:Mitochondrial carrier protein n=2 Tax=Vitrella brassicaformis TaxID=1169539 RepID=A0A0G4H4F1_VITBC|nr:unnamed protein product [Vitrella brassicaformis CCMP3155]|eukprot:CEM38396.1 unnamed protein product [Vitrella brassicaformis CCMP3155]
MLLMLFCCECGSVPSSIRHLVTANGLRNALPKRTGQHRGTADGGDGKGALQTSRSVLPRLKRRKRRAGELPATEQPAESRPERRHRRLAALVRRPMSFSLLDGLSLPLHDKGKLTFWGNMLAGALSRSVAQTAVHPLIGVKTLLQGRNTWQGWGYFLGHPGIWWRGAGAQFLISLPHGAMNFAVLGFMKHQMTRLMPIKQAGFVFDFCSQASATFLCSVISTPQMVLVDRIVTGIYPNLVSGLSKLLRTEGVRGLYTGWFPGMIQKIPSYSLTWVAYQQLRNLHSVIFPRDPSDAENFLIGATAAGIVVAIMIPVDTVKTRLVTQATLGAVQPYKGIIDCFLRVIKEEGVGRLYRALPMRLMSVVPMIGIQFGVYEYVKSRLLSDPHMAVKHKPDEKQEEREEGEEGEELPIPLARIRRRIRAQIGAYVWPR